jgi:hypothetical protein
MTLRSLRHGKNEARSELAEVPDLYPSPRSIDMCLTRRGGENGPSRRCLHASGMPRHIASVQ